MTRIYYGKLIRNRIPELISQDGMEYKVRRLSKRRYQKALREKVLEEATELRSSKGKKAVLNELIDIQELINASLRNLGVAPKKFRELVKRKRRERGGFTKRLLLESVEGPKASHSPTHPRGRRRPHRKPGKASR